MSGGGEGGEVIVIDFLLSFPSKGHITCLWGLFYGVWAE